MTYEQLMTIEDVAQYLRVAERTVYDWAQKGEIPCGKVGAAWRFRRADIDRWLDKRLRRSVKETSAADVCLEEVLSLDRVVYLEASTKREALLALIDCLAATPQVGSRDELREGILEREELMSTGIGLGIGVPHVRLPSVKNIVMALGVCSVPLVDYESLDGEPVRLIFMIAAGREQHAKHIRLLSLIASKCRIEAVREAMLRARDASELMSVLLNSASETDVGKDRHATHE